MLLERLCQRDGFLDYRPVKRFSGINYFKSRNCVLRRHCDEVVTVMNAHVDTWAEFLKGLWKISRRLSNINPGDVPLTVEGLAGGGNDYAAFFN